MLNAHRYVIMALSIEDRVSQDGSISNELWLTVISATRGQRKEQKAKIISKKKFNTTLPIHPGGCSTNM
jgi:hypothetical protein